MDRVVASAPAIVQIVVAATVAFSFAHYVLGHAAPLLAATVTVSSLGLVRDARPRRVLETVIGMIVGILVAEIIVLVAGIGWWQLGLTLAASLVIARFLSPQPAFAIAAAIQSAIVMVIPVSVPFLRMIDGVVGGVTALLVTALLPRSPLRAVTREGAELFAAFDGALATLVQALRRGDPGRAERGLRKARALQGLVDQWRAGIESGSEIARISPFLRAQRPEFERQERVRVHVDLATRNLRVIARRIVYLCDDRTARPIAADLLNELGAGARLIADALGDISYEPAARGGRPRGRGPPRSRGARGPQLGRRPDPHRGDASARRRPHDCGGHARGRGACRHPAGLSGIAGRSVRRPGRPASTAR
ncbi:FUSC family protein [Microbacterium hominis]|uniref:FUSC family protein n=1 Tax=Microbacterium hominis TaxID=162426 RepID=UPI001CC31B17|nr:FUSC family protein [Microbacterium hominis]